MPRLHRRPLARSVFASTAALFAAGLVTAPAGAATLKPVDTTLQLVCADGPDFSEVQRAGALRLRGSVPATTTDGQLVSFRDIAADLRLEYPSAGPDNGATISGVVSHLGVDVTGTGEYPQPTAGSQTFTTWGPSTTVGFPSTPRTNGGFGPVSLPLFPFREDQVQTLRTEGTGPVTLRPGILLLMLRNGYNGQTPVGIQSLIGCKPVEGQPPIATIPNVTTTPSPTVTTVSPTFGPMSGGNTITVHGTGFSESPDVSVLFENAPFPATDVHVIDDTTLTAVVPELYIETSVRIQVQVGDRISRFTANQNYESVFDGPIRVVSVTPTSGREGDILTVTGWNTNALKSFTFGAVKTGEGDVPFNGSDTITVRVPKGVPGTTVALAACGLFSCATFEGASTFTYLPDALPPLPAVSVLAPGLAVAGKGSLHYLLGTRLTSVKTIRVGTRSVKPLVVLNQKLAVFQSPALAAGTYPVSLVGKDGRTATTTTTITYR